MFEAILLFFIVVLCAFLFLFKDKSFVPIRIALSFSGAFLLSVIIFEMLPKSYEALGSEAGLYIIIGLLLQNFLEFYSKGAEHGHFHVDREHSFTQSNVWVVYIALCIHAVLEGFPMQASKYFLIAVALHKIPVSILLAVFFKRIQLPIQKAFLWIVVFALMTPLGVLGLRFIPILSQFDMEISAFVSGLLLHIATIILFESKEGSKHDFDRGKLISFLIAATLAYFITKVH